MSAARLALVSPPPPPPGNVDPRLEAHLAIAFVAIVKAIDLRLCTFVDRPSRRAMLAMVRDRVNVCIDSLDLE